MRKFTATMFGVVTMIGLLSYPSATVEAQGRSYGDRYVRTYSKADVDRVIRRAEDRSDIFRRTVDDQLDRSRLNGSRTEDRINEQVKQLENALDDLRSEFNRRSSWMDTRVDVERVMRQSNEVNSIVRRTRFGTKVEREWEILRSDLNTLAGVYNLRPIRS
ncbi:MAG TPA: hypothetical protein VFV95_03435 [Vicinamibacterales bacterium]|nr:hypothetical protein [Vicinamibacterales bacterium]